MHTLASRAGGLLLAEILVKLIARRSVCARIDARYQGYCRRFIGCKCLSFVRLELVLIGYTNEQPILGDLGISALNRSPSHEGLQAKSSWLHEVRVRRENIILVSGRYSRLGEAAILF